MKHPVVVLAAALLLSLATPASPAAQEVDLDAVGARLEEEAGRILEETGIPSISMALVRDGEVAWAGAWGWANVAARVPATPETYYSTGSTFKFVTATAVMQLVEAGKLDLDTPLNDLVDPGLRIEGAGDVTLRHLLSHRSGLQGPVGTVPLWSRQAPRTPDTLLARTERVGPPGEEFRYCNECYAIAGLVVAEVSGQSWDEYVAEHILGPVGVDVAAPSVPSPEVVERMALPYSVADNRPTPAPQVRYDVFAAGDAYLRPSDMARFLGAHIGDGAFGGARILSAASAAEMRRPQFPGNNYGLGVASGEADGVTYITHNGAIPGFNSVMIGEPATGLGVYAMSNADVSAGGPALEALSRLAIRLMKGDDPEPLASFAAVERVAVEIDPAVFDAYVGEYRLRPEFVITVSREGDRFFVQATGQGRLEIQPESETEFFLTAVDAQVTFGRDDPDGPVTHLVLHQAGQRQRADRIR